MLKKLKIWIREGSFNPTPIFWAQYFRAPFLSWPSWFQNLFSHHGQPWYIQQTLNFSQIVFSIGRDNHSCHNLKLKSETLFCKLYFTHRQRVQTWLTNLNWVQSLRFTYTCSTETESQQYLHSPITANLLSWPRKTKYSLNSTKNKARKNLSETF